LQFHARESVTKLCVDAISRVSQYHATVHVGRYRRPDLIQRDFRLGLKPNFFGYFSRFPPLVSAII
jgi:hypothetical protein